MSRKAIWCAAFLAALVPAFPVAGHVAIVDADAPAPSQAAVPPPSRPVVNQPTEGERVLTGTYTASDQPKEDVVALVNGFVVANQTPTLDAGSFTIEFPLPLASGATVQVTHRVFADAEAEEPAAQSDSAVLIVEAAAYDWGRSRAEFTFGAVLSKEREEFSQTDLYLDFNLEYSWVAPHAKAADKPRNLLFNSFFTTRLTTIPVTVDTATAAASDDPPPAPEPEPDDVSSFIASKKGALIQFGFYVPVFRDNWTWETTDQTTNVFFVAPIIKFGFQSINEDLKLIRNDPDDLFESYSFGARFGHLTYRDGPDEGTELITYLDLTLGKWENFEECVGRNPEAAPSSCGEPPGGGTKVSDWRLGLEGRLQVPRAPIVVGIDLNAGRDRDDVRFILGTRFDIARLIGKLGG